MPSPSVAIILVNWNGYTFTRQCLLSLKNVSYSNYFVVVVDNASTDGSMELLRKEFEAVAYIQNQKNEGFTGGNNTGMAYALQQKVDYICLLNNDTEVEPDFLDHLIKRIESDENIGAVQPKIFYNGRRDVLWNAGGYFNKVTGFPKVHGENQPDNEKYNRAKEVDWITGCCFLLRSATVVEAGKLDHHYFAYFEDVEWSFRIQATGRKLVYEPSAVIYHEAGVSSKAKQKGKEGFLSPYAHYLNVRNHLYLLRQYAKPIFIPSVVLGQVFKFAGYTAYFTLRGRFQKLKIVWKGFRDGLFLPLKEEKPV